MEGRKVFSEAVRTMIASLHRVCDQKGLNIDQLDLIVPHQANRRILDAAFHALGIEEDVPRVQPLLKHRDWKMRAAAYEALGRMRAVDIPPAIADHIEVAP